MNERDDAASDLKVKSLDDHEQTQSNVSVGSTSATIAAPETDAAPRLYPAPGRCIVRIIPRLIEVEAESGIHAALDGRYQNQPMIGSLYAIGDPRNDDEKVIADWAIEERDAGHYFVFSNYGGGTPYWDDEMRKMLPLGYDFSWLAGYRLFDIGQLSATVSGTDQYGAAINSSSSSRKSRLRLNALVEVQ